MPFLIGSYERPSPSSVLPINLFSIEATDWSWRSHDTGMLMSCFVIGSIGTFTAALSLALAFRKHSSEEGTSLLPRAGWHRLRILSLAGIGLSPLMSCVIVGESSDNVIYAMVAMHWIVMLAFPALYYNVTLREQNGLSAEVVPFYLGLWDSDTSRLLRKLGRGIAMGIPLLITMLAGYTLMRCRTLRWDLCIGTFQKPLEGKGFEDHGMPFRILCALYFSFWNPFIEEFFWRVFLHRELSIELGRAPKQESSESEAPWSQFLRDVLEVFSLGATQEAKDQAIVSAQVCWGVSFMYASYHTWPMFIIFPEKLSLLYTILGFVFLACLGRFFLLLRESADFGLPAAYALHVCVDIAFALLCLFELHPYTFGMR